MEENAAFRSGSDLPTASHRHLRLCEASEGDATDRADALFHYDWNDEEPAAKNYAALGRLLARGGDLFRRPGYGSGLLLVLPDGKHVPIRTGADLAPVVVDRVAVTVYLDGKPKGSRSRHPTSTR